MAHIKCLMKDIVEWLISLIEKKREKGKAFDYIQKHTGYIRQSFSYSMTLNSNIFTQAKADRLLFLE